MVLNPIGLGGRRNVKQEICFSDVFRRPTSSIEGSWRAWGGTLLMTTGRLYLQYPRPPVVETVSMLFRIFQTDLLIP